MPLAPLSTVNTSGHFDYPYAYFYVKDLILYAHFCKALCLLRFPAFIYRYRDN